jgi:hypothetical protein
MNSSPTTTHDETPQAARRVVASAVDAAARGALTGDMTPSMRDSVAVYLISP